MAAVKIPPGIYPVKWRNKKEKGIQERYRVKVKRKEYQADKLFDTLDEAITFLDNLKSPKGREAMTKEDALTEAKKEAVRDWFKNPNLGWYLDEYYKRYVSGPVILDAINGISKPTAVTSRSIKTLEYLKDGIKRVEISFTPKGAGDNVMSPRLGQTIRSLKSSKKLFGDIKLIDIDEAAASAYIYARSRQVASPTVEREISMLGSLYSKLKFIDKKAWEAHPRRFCRQLEKGPGKGENRGVPFPRHAPRVHLKVPRPALILSRRRRAPGRHGERRPHGKGLHGAAREGKNAQRRHRQRA